MPFITIPWLSCVIIYFMGLMAGRWLAGVLDYRIGHRIGKIVLFGILTGMSLSPLVFLPVLIVSLLQTAFTGPQLGLMEALTGIVNTLFSPVCFVVGVMRPTVWGERR